VLSGTLVVEVRHELLMDRSLFDVYSPFPLRVWDRMKANSIVRVRWSSSRPSVFFALDVFGIMYVFDLQKDLNVRARSRACSIYSDIVPEVARLCPNRIFRESQHVCCVAHRTCAANGRCCYV